MIAMYIPIKDVLSLVKSTKAFLPISSDQTYWASVFDYEAECDFFFEGPYIRATPDIDWIRIYKKRCTRRIYRRWRTERGFGL